MKEPTVEELREWSATEVMGWEYFIPRDPRRIYYGKEEGDCQVEKFFWRPDDPNTGQIWMVVERMKELGFEEFLLTRTFTNNGCSDFDKWIGKFAAMFNIKNGLGKAMLDDNPCLAILKAAWAALKEAT